MDPSHLFMNRPHILYVSNFGRNGNPRVLKFTKIFGLKIKNLCSEPKKPQNEQLQNPEHM